MCTNIMEKARIFGSGKSAQGWLAVNHVYVGYDHPSHAPLDHAVLIDFVDETQGPSARVAVELSAESAQALIEVIQAALEAGRAQHVVDDLLAISKTS